MRRQLSGPYHKDGTSNKALFSLILRAEMKADSNTRSFVQPESRCAAHGKPRVQSGFKTRHRAELSHVHSALELVPSRSKAAKCRGNLNRLLCQHCNYKCCAESMSTCIGIVQGLAPLPPLGSQGGGSTGSNKSRGLGLRRVNGA